MNKITQLLIAICLIFGMAACSSSSTATSAVSSPLSGLVASNTLSSKLGAGLLMLEGTGQAVTAEQAANLLPLWQAYRNLSASSSSSQGEIQALYSQIQESLTSEQLAAIQQVELSQANLASLMQKFSVQSAPSGARSQASTTSSSTSNSASGGGAGAAPADMGGGSPPADMAMGGDMSGGMGGDMSGAVVQSASTTTQQASSSTSGKSTSTSQNSNTLFVEAVIQVLTQRAQS
jgi:hypothetical protein